MKAILIVIIFAISIAACNQADKKTKDVQKTGTKQEGSVKNPLEDSSNFTTMQWLDSTFHDFGKVEEGQVVDVAFRFKNTGNKPLIITNVFASCGCTSIPEKPKEPYAQGQEGIIKARFDSKNMAGERHKEVYVSANTKGTTTHILTFRVEVVKK